jgi:hypothetical protein
MGRKQIGLAAVLVLFSFNTFAFGSRPIPPDPVEPPSSDTKIISDSLVSKLACAGISEDSVMAAIQPGAFSIERQLPVKNWPAPFDMAECWSLSHFQRMLYYMGRFGSPVDMSPVYLGVLEDTARGYNDAYPEVFPVSSASDVYHSMSDFKGDIEHYQDWRFTRPGNLEFLLGERDRSGDDNQRTFEQIAADLPRGRKPLIVIRAQINWQHVVLIKSAVQMDEDTYELNVYDSNYPAKENQLTYKVSEREFYAQDVLALDPFKKHAHIDSKDPVGVFVVDEEDMDGIQHSLFDYYKGLCDRAN